MFSNYLRKNGFWILDQIKGGSIKKHYDSIALIQEKYNSAEARELRSTYLLDLLKHTTATVPFYQNLKQTTNLEDFPVITKTRIQENFKTFFSSQYNDKTSYKVSTSGSTGIPFILYQNKNKKLRNTADTIYFLQQANYSLGEKLYDLEVWRGINMNSPAKALLQNLTYLDITKFSDDKIENFLTKLKKEKAPQHLIGFTSAYENICEYLDRTNADPLRTEVKSIIAISEYLTPYVKDRMQHYFQVPIVSRYSSEEVGIMAQQSAEFDSTAFQLNWASYHFEILDLNQDIPVKPGGLGRIVVTDFFNYCMPLIRYDTGDIAILNDPKNNEAPTLKRIEGRKMDLIYNTKGELISSFLVYTKFYDYYHLLNQYQFIQKDIKNYIVKLNIKDTSFPYEKKLIASFKEDFGEDALVEVEYVDEIPALSSGKRKKVVSLFSSN